MAPYKDEHAPILLPLLRALRGWDQRTLADAARLAQPSISRFESGDPISPDVLERIVAAVGLELSWVERRLLPVLRTAREKAAAAAANPLRHGSGRGAAQDFGPQDDATLETAIREAMDLVLGAFETAAEAAENAAMLKPRPPSPADREEAARSWDRIASCTAADQRWLVEQGEELQTWALAEKLCHESERAAPRGAAAALDLANLAISVAQLVTGGEPWRLRLQGYARAFLGNAQRVAGDLVAAAAEFSAAWNLWRSGADVGDVTLEEWRLLDLEASLRRDTRHFQAAFDLLDRAAALAPPHAAGRILLKRAYTLELSGDAAGAIAALHDAAPLIAADDARLRFALDFNLATSKCQLGQYAEVEAQLPRLRQQALELGNAHDQMQVVWLTGRVAAGCGRQGEACAAFEEVQKQSEDEGHVLGAAIVSLELALIYLDQGRTAEVRHLAASMVWILTERRVDREALAALRLFCDTAARDAATLDQARRALDLLQHRAQPTLSIAT